MRRDRIPGREFEPEGKQAFLARIAEQNRRPAPGGKMLGSRPPLDFVWSDDRVRSSAEATDAKPASPIQPTANTDPIFMA